MKVERLKMKGFHSYMIALFLVSGMMLLAAPAYGDGASQEQMIKDLQRMSMLPMRSTSYMVSNRQIHVAQPQNVNTNMPKASGNVFTYFGSKELQNQKRVWMADQLFLNGQNLMSTGSRYASNTGGPNNASLTTPPPHRPYRKPGDQPGEPFLDPIGDAVLPLMLLACAFAFGKWVARRTKPLR